MIRGKQSFKKIAVILLSALVGMVVLSGCVKYDGKVVVSENDTVSGSYYVGFNVDALVQMAESMEQMGAESSQPPQNIKEEFKKQIQDGIAQSPQTPGITPEYLEKDGFMGVNILLDDVTLDVYNQFAAQGLGGSMGTTGTDGDSGGLPVILRKGDQFVVKWETSGLNESSQTGEEGASAEPIPGFEDMMGQFMPQVDMQITFPGAVTEANGGIVMGNTVKWDLAGLPKEGVATVKASAIPNGQGQPPAESAQPTATPQMPTEAVQTPEATDARDTTSNSFPLVPILIGGIVVLGAIAAVAVVVAMSSKKKKDGQTPGAGYDQQPYNNVGDGAPNTQGYPEQMNPGGTPPQYPPTQQPPTQYPPTQQPPQ